MYLTRPHIAADSHPLNYVLEVAIGQKISAGISEVTSIILPIFISRKNHHPDISFTVINTQINASKCLTFIFSHQTADVTLVPARGPVTAPWGDLWDDPCVRPPRSAPGTCGGRASGPHTSGHAPTTIPPQRMRSVSPARW